MDKVKYIYYSIGGFFEGHDILRFERLDNTKITRFNPMDCPEEITFKTLEYFDLILIDVQSMVKDWKEYYEDPKFIICDGTQWEILLSVHSKDETDTLISEVEDPNEVPGVWHSGGSNYYPKNFRRLEKYMAKIYDEQG